MAELATLGSLLPFLSLVAGVGQPTHTPSFTRVFAALGATTRHERLWAAARAIYKGSPVLVLDEATSALDDVTEAAVMEALEGRR